MKQWCQDVGLRGNFGSHTLGKTWGYQRRMQGAAIPLLMEAFAWKDCRVCVIIIDDHAMPSYHLTPAQRAARPGPEEIAVEIGHQVEGLWWVDAERGVEASMKEGPR